MRKNGTFMKRNPNSAGVSPVAFLLVINLEMPLQSSCLFQSWDADVFPWEE